MATSQLLDLIFYMEAIAADQCQALFNVMLKDFGVKGVKVQEIVSLDEEMMAFIQYVFRVIHAINIRYLLTMSGIQ